MNMERIALAWLTERLDYFPFENCDSVNEARWQMASMEKEFLRCLWVVLSHFNIIICKCAHLIIKCKYVAIKCGVRSRAMFSRPKCCNAAICCCSAQCTHIAGARQWYGSGANFSIPFQCCCVFCFVERVLKFAPICCGTVPRNVMMALSVFVCGAIYRPLDYVVRLAFGDMRQIK